ncbi:MAG: hypothetical protein JWP76_1609 [Dactylosporangium sp.]|nr:hypothetical protein [Dactylosporangium sp.]
MRKTLTTAALVAVATGAFVAGVAGPAAATTPTCDNGPKTVVTHLVNRPDSGHHGDWALDTMDRKVTITKVEATQPTIMETNTWSYQAVVTDEGTFVTKGGEKLSPNKGQDLPAGVSGKISGKFTVDFTAPACFRGYQGNHGDLSTKTGKWVAKVWGDDELNITTNLDANYQWTYTTCSERWLDAYNNEDGQAEGAGDITGKACPTPTATATPTAAATPSTGGQAGGLPVTGSNTGILAGGAVLLVAVGAGLFLVGHRRRKFTA